MRVEVTREFGPDDGINRRVWWLSLNSDWHGCIVRVDEYREQTRAYTRHKWRTVKGNGTQVTDPMCGRQLRDPYTIPDDVAKEALGYFIDETCKAMRTARALAEGLGK